MPRTTFPPTPASSTDIQGQDGSKQLASLQTSFELPPPALNAGSSAENAAAAAAKAASGDINTMSPPIYPETSNMSSSPSAKQSVYPVQAAETVKSRRRSSTLQNQAQAKDAFSLPPPPTRSRKIIQMKPRASNTGGAAGSGALHTGGPALAPASATASAPAGGKSATGKGSAASTASGTATSASSASSSTATVTPASAPATTAGGKKKQPSATSAAGRKIARKTAHSLIERRRRSKMNEEFAVLKSMIPACTGEMHKLAILQASIEYVRYLEDCVATLKAQRESEGQNASPIDESRLPTPSGQYNPERHYPASYADDQLSPDVEMADTGKLADDDEDDEDDEDNDDGDLPSPTNVGQHPHNHSASVSSRSATHQPSVSPALLAQDATNRRQQRHDSQSSTASLAPASDHHRHYSYSTSAQTSPAFGPQVSASFHHYGSLSTTASNPGSTLTSPALGPQRDLDQEATAALLMLNNDRRGAGGNNASGRGMSVRDLLST